MAPTPTHSKFLEINLVSAEDLAPISRNMKTYAVIWVQPDQKFTTSVDQIGGIDPTWNDRFMFKVDDKFLNSEDATIVVEIYAAAWVKDALVGYVNVLINDIFHLRSIANANVNNSSTKRTVTLQIRRPSGRPQGILNMEVALVDSNMPQIEQDNLKPNKTSSQEMESHDGNNEPPPHKTNENAKISRFKSDTTELKIEENMEKTGPDRGSLVNVGLGSNDNKGNGSMVNGDSLCNSDVGPSASIVAAAIAKGLYITPFTHHQAQTNETTQISEWTKKEREEEDLSKKLARWQSLTPVKSRESKKRSKKKRKDVTRLFSCFGNICGVEVSISCGPSMKKYDTVINNKVCHLSSIHDYNSQSMV